MASADPSIITATASLIASLAAAGAALYSRAQQQQAEAEKEARMRAQKDADEDRERVSERLAVLENKGAAHDVTLARLDEAHDHVSKKLDGLDGKMDRVLEAVLSRPRRETR